MKTSSLFSPLVAVLVPGSLIGSSNAAVTMLDLDSIANSTILSNQFLEQGVLISGQGAFNGQPIVDFGGYLFLSGTWANQYRFTFDFVESGTTIPIANVVSFSLLTAPGFNAARDVSFDAYDIAGNQVTTDAWTGPDGGMAQELRIDSDVPFSKLHVIISRQPTALRDLSFTTIPEPSSACLLGAALSLLAMRRKRS